MLYFKYKNHLYSFSHCWFDPGGILQQSCYRYEPDNQEFELIGRWYEEECPFDLRDETIDVFGEESTITVLSTKKAGDLETLGTDKDWAIKLYNTLPEPVTDEEAAYYESMLSHDPHVEQTDEQKKREAQRHQDFMDVYGDALPPD